MAAAATEDDLPGVRAMSLPAAHPFLPGGRLAYRDAGTPGAPPLVLLHGIGSTSRGFQYQLTVLGGPFHVIAWEMPGYGESDALRTETPSAHDYADALGALLDGLAVQRCHLLGSSLGAIIAAAFVATRPDRISTLVLSSPALGHAGLPLEERAAKLHMRLGEMKQTASSERDERRARNLAAPSATAEALAAARAQLAPTDRPGYGAAARMLSAADILRDTARIETPTLVVSGAEDRVTPTGSCAARIQASMRRARLEIVEGAGHLVHLERPAAFNRLVGEFVRANGPGHGS